jgi:hypothetical protein
MNSATSPDIPDLGQSNILVVALSDKPLNTNYNSFQKSGAYLDTIRADKLRDVDINLYDLIVVADDKTASLIPLRSLVAYIATLARIPKLIITSDRDEDPELTRVLIHSCDAIIGCPMEYPVFVSAVNKVVSKASNFPMRHFDDASENNKLKKQISITRIAGLSVIGLACYLGLRLFVL